MRRFCVLCVLKFGTVCSVLFFYIVLFVCVRAAFYGAINDNKIIIKVQIKDNKKIIKVQINDNKIIIKVRINDNKITEVGVVPAVAARNLNTRKTVRALFQLFSKQNIDGKCGRVRA